MMLRNSKQTKIFGHDEMRNYKGCLKFQILCGRARLKKKHWNRIRHLQYRIQNNDSK